MIGATALSQPQRPTMAFGQSAATLGACLLLCYAVAAMGGLATMEGVRVWYPGLDKPPWTTPNWAFGPIWSVLYTLTAVGAWDALRRNGRTAAFMYGLYLAWIPVAWSLNAWIAAFNPDL